MSLQYTKKLTNQLLFLINSIHESFELSREVRYVFLDISKAFDKVWHEGLLFKLQQNGISGTLFKLFASYLSNRYQRVVLNGCESEWGLVESGVPLGSALGPLLFLIYINDLEKGILSEVKFFAYDTSLFSIVTDPVQSALDLNHDLYLIGNWAHQWKMSFNPDPTKQAIEVLFSQKRKNVVHPPLFFNNQTVSRSAEHKHLGLILDSKLSFSKHLSVKIATARKGIGIIKYLSSYVPITTLSQIYKMYVRPHLDYCDIIYHIPSSINLNVAMKRVESTQYQAGLAVSGAWKGSSTIKVYKELGWESLTERRMFRRKCHFYKILNGFTPAYLKSPIPTERDTTRFRNKDPYRAIGGSTRYNNSFYPNCITLWNSIGENIRNSPTLNSFKSSLLKDKPIPKPESFFGILNPFGTKTIFQLRVGLSRLKSHKKRHKFKDTPSDIYM